jgi:DNA-binding SARP family transcriptional activator
MIRAMAALRATLAAGAWLVGVPALLLVVAGNPLPRRRPPMAQIQTWLNEPLEPAYVRGTALVMIWLFWAVVTACIAMAAVRRVRRWDCSRLAVYLPGPVQGLAATLLGAATATSAGVTPAAQASMPPTAAEPADYLGPSARPHTTAAARSLSSTVEVQKSVTVKRGDTLTKIAQKRLGDAHRWADIYRLNRGHVQANGYALTDPDAIHVGWTLKLPTTTTAKPQVAAPPKHATSKALPPASGEPERSTPSPAVSSPGPTTCLPSVSTSPTPPSRGARVQDEAGLTLPSQGWVSLGLAALLAAVASLLRLQRRRRALLRYPVPTRISADPAPVLGSLAPVDTVRGRHLPSEGEPLQATAPAVPAPIGLDSTGDEVSLFDLRSSGLALIGDGAESAARAVLAASLATNATSSAEIRPVVVTTTETLARLLPTGAALVGLDPNGTSYDGERLIVLADAAAAVTHAEEEMILRRRLLDTFDADSIPDLNARTDHAEAQPAYVLLIEANSRHAPRILAVGTHRAALHLHPVIIGELAGLSAVKVAADGTTGDEQTLGLRRLSTLAATDLAAVLAVLTDITPRPEPGTDIDTPAPGEENAAAASAEPAREAAEPVPAQTVEVIAPVRLCVLGPVRLTTDTGPVTTGMRSGSYTVLASLAVHPAGRTLEQLAADLHPDTDPVTAAKRIRTDINTTRRVLRTATGSTEEMFVVYDPATGRYRLDPQLFAVDLWQMLTTLERANNAPDDTAALTALRQAADLYDGDFAEGQDRAWITDYASSYRHQILAVYARIAEITEIYHPEQAIAALHRAIDLDPINEELYQRIMRIHGRVQRPDAVRQTLRRLEERLADLDAEPSEATRRIAERQLQPVTSGGHR